MNLGITSLGEIAIKEKMVLPTTHTIRTSQAIHLPSLNFCDYCKKPGHTRDNFYRIHGFPLDFKFIKGRNTTSATNVHTECEVVEGVTHDQGFQHLTKERYNQLLSLLEKFPGRKIGESSNNIACWATNLTCILAYSTYKEIVETTVCKCSKLVIDLWILDIGASNHMTYRKSFLNNIRTLSYPFLVTLPNRYRVKVTKIGDAFLGPMLTLVRVLYVPSFKYNLIFIHSLTDHLNFIVNFNKYLCMMQAIIMKRPLEIGKARGDCTSYAQCITIVQSLVYLLFLPLFILIPAFLH